MSDTPAEIARKLVQSRDINRAVYTLEERIAMALERKDERIRELEQERDNLKHRVSRARFDLPGTYFHCMSGHYYAGTRGDEECPVCERLQRLEQANKELLEALQRLLPLAMDAVPQRGHVGACGPEAGCDGLCVDAANCAEVLLFARAAIAAAQIPVDRQKSSSGTAVDEQRSAVLSKHGGTK